MNLHGIARGAIQVVNPFVLGRVIINSGYTTDPAGNRKPSYGPIFENVPMQVQPVGFRDLSLVEGLNLQGTRRTIYLEGKLDGLIRVDGKGGDIVEFPPGTSFPFGTVWLVAMVLEQWPDWVAVAATLQNETLTINPLGR
jgi:hypothetical protein